MKVVQKIRKKWKPRKSASHKGDYGRIFIIAGSRGLTGAAHLAGMGALRCGAGLVTVGVPDKVYTVIAKREAEVMVRPFPSTLEGTLAYRSLKPISSFLKNQDVLAMGPGLSQNSQTQKLIYQLAAKSNLPMVIDADGINAFKGKASLLRQCSGRTILTPHPGEFCRVFGGKLSSKDADRKARAKEFARKSGCIIVLKGHRTVVASPSGEVFINSTGNPGMASGGVGDVLTGMIAALIGQKFPLLHAACFGVYLHGLAGDLAAKKVGQVSLVASDVLDYLPAAFRKAIGR